MKVDILCLGNPEIEGDSIGPRVGTLLQHTLDDVNIVGTMEEPVIRSTFHAMIERLRDDAIVIAVDAAIGKEVGSISVVPTGIKPGHGIQKWDKPTIGNYSVTVTTGKTIADLVTFPKGRAAVLATDVSRMLMAHMKYLQK